MRLIETPYAETRLIFLGENHPNKIDVLMASGDLKRVIEQEVQRALDLKERLEKEGKLQKDQIEEIFLNQLAPAEEIGLRNVKPMSPGEIEKVYKELLELDE